MAELPGTLSGMVPSASAVLLVARHAIRVCPLFDTAPHLIGTLRLTTWPQFGDAGCCGGFLILFSCKTIVLLSCPPCGITLSNCQFFV